MATTFFIIQICSYCVCTGSDPDKNVRERNGFGKIFACTRITRVGQFFLMYTFVPVSINVSIHSNIIRQSLWLCHLPVSFIMSVVSIHSNIIRQSLWLCHLPVSFIMSVVSIHSYITRQSLWLCHRPVSFIMSCTC